MDTMRIAKDVRISQVGATPAPIRTRIAVGDVNGMKLAIFNNRMFGVEILKIAI
ncbi:hypothetical protein D3C76_1461550 [compost metagenome]